MEAIGTLAGGIAHDFNNILTGIIGFAQIADLKLEKNHPVKRRIQAILEGGERAKDLVSQILSFSRQGQMEKIPVDISHIIKEALNLLRSSLPTTIEINRYFEKETGIIEADPTQIHQVIMNLCTNAAHAMRDKGGILNIRLSNIYLEKNNSYTNAGKGKYLNLTISDTGHGIPEKFLERIFEPYFTTKEKGEGTGLGLAVVHGIITGFKGFINVKSKINKGTTFDIIFPLIEQKKEVINKDSEINLKTGNEKILLIDDEKIIIGLEKEILISLGYEVISETDAEKAVKIFEKNSNNIDLVITDMTMPHLTGLELAKKIKKIKPEISVILCSGFSEHITPDKMKNAGVNAFLQKPLDLENFSHTIRDVLNKKKK